MEWSANPLKNQRSKPTKEVLDLEADGGRLNLVPSLRLQMEAF